VAAGRIDRTPEPATNAVVLAALPTIRIAMHLRVRERAR
jgi:hypothetical protein